MAVLKVWDGASWVPVGAGAPAVASPLTVSAGGVLDIQQASDVQEGSLAAADHVKVGYLRDWAGHGGLSTPGYLYLDGSYINYLTVNAQYDGTNWQKRYLGYNSALIQMMYDGQITFSDAPSATNPVSWNPYLRFSGAGNTARISSQGGPFTIGGNVAAYIDANLYYDPSNGDMRFGTAYPALRQKIGMENGGAVEWWYAPPGANPVTAWATFMRSTFKGNTLVIEAPAGGGVLTSKVDTGFAVNAYFDGTNWLRYDVGKPAALVDLSAYDGSLYMTYAPAGANPIAWTQSYPLALPQQAPAIGWTNIQELVTWGSGWERYEPGYSYWAMCRRDAAGWVHLRGLVCKSSAVTPGETICTFPTGWRWGDTGMFGYGVKGVFSAVSNDAPCALELGSDGTLKARAGCNAAWVSLDGISWSIT